MRKKREHETHFEGDNPYNSQRTYNKEHFTTNKVFNSIYMSVEQLIYTLVHVTVYTHMYNINNGTEFRV